MNRRVILIGLMLIIFFIGCSEDNSTSPSESSILGTWYNTEEESEIITFYPDGFVYISWRGGHFLYSYLESEKRGFIRSKNDYFETTFEIIDNLLYLGDKTFRK